MNSSPLINQLIEAFKCLPGVGPKSAQRMTLFLLERNRSGGIKLSESLAAALNSVGNCKKCRNLTEDEVCSICANHSRDKSLCCVVESPADIFAIEQAGTFKGVYFVLMGRLSPIDGIGPTELGIDLLVTKVKTNLIKEVILACNPTVEGDATAYYIAEQLKHFRTKVTRIAHGIPVGGELEFVDGGTLSYAFSGRKLMLDDESHATD